MAFPKQIFETATGRSTTPGLKNQGNLMIMKRIIIRQDHYQLFFDHKFGTNLTFNTALFLTKGKGYYEQYKAGEEYAAYGMMPPSLSCYNHRPHPATLAG